MTGSTTNNAPTREIVINYLAALPEGELTEIVSEARALAKKNAPRGVKAGTDRYSSRRNGGIK